MHNPLQAMDHSHLQCFRRVLVAQHQHLHANGLQCTDLHMNHNPWLVWVRACGYWETVMCFSRFGEVSHLGRQVGALGRPELEGNLPLVVHMKAVGCHGNQQCQLTTQVQRQTERGVRLQGHPAAATVGTKAVRMGRAATARVGAVGLPRLGSSSSRVAKSRLWASELSTASLLTGW